jgi:ribokinase
MSILVLGSINTDLVIRSPRIPVPGETVLGGRYFQSPGGKGANQAVAAARAARSPVTFIAAVGDDDFGRAALDNFARENLDCQFIKTVTDQPSGVALIFVDEAGENAISVASGANWHLLPADVDAIPDSAFTPGGVFLCSLECRVETVVRGLQRARAADMTTILNPAPATLEIADPHILSLVDVLTPNEGEAAMLAGMNLATESSTTIAAQLRELGCRQVITTLGSQGCLVVGDEVTEIPSIDVTAIDTTAAGDAFNGALAVALSEGRSLPAAASWANGAAALAVTRPGAQPSLATREEIDDVAG